MELLPESLLNIVYDGEVSNDNTGPSAADNAEAIPHTSNGDNCLQLMSSEMVIPTDTAVNYSEAQSSQYSQMKNIATPNLEVLKNSHHLKNELVCHLKALQRSAGQKSNITSSHNYVRNNLYC